MHICFISYRVAGNDGVSLEADRWHKILTRMGHKVTFVAGELDRGGIMIPELHFSNPKIVELHDKVVYGKNHFKKIEEEVFEYAGKIEGKLRKAFNEKKPDMLIVANCLSLPMNFPLAIALTRVIEELKIPTIARHHDFWWERKRFLKSSCFPFFKRWFPPVSPYIKHVTINSISQQELKDRLGIESAVIPDTFDYESTKSYLDRFNSSFRKDFGIAKEDIVFLQATRVVPRKRIELAMKLVKKLNNKKVVLIIAGKPGDEGNGYFDKLLSTSDKLKIRIIYVGDRIDFNRKITMGGRKIYTLWDAFINSDFMTYPSEVEGFGNQYIESVYFKKPVIITPYPVYLTDIKPLGFKSIEISKKINKNDVDLVKKYLKDRELVKDIIDANFELGRNSFSYEATQKKIEQLINQ